MRGGHVRGPCGRNGARPRAGPTVAAMSLDHTDTVYAALTQFAAAHGDATGLDIYGRLHTAAAPKGACGGSCGGACARRADTAPKGCCGGACACRPAAQAPSRVE